jgi:hypothetical protein
MLLCFCPDSTPILCFLCFLCFHGQVGKSPIGSFPNVWRPTRHGDRTGGGNLESGILSNLHRDDAQAGKPGGRVRAAGRYSRSVAMRPRRTIFAAFAPIAGAAVAARAQRVPPPPPSDVHPGLQPAPTIGAAGVLWLDASQPLPVDQTAIDNNNAEAGTLGTALAATKRPVAATGESGGNGGN